MERHLLRFQRFRTTEYITFMQSVVPEIEVNVIELNITHLFHFSQFVFWITNKIYGTFVRNRLSFQSSVQKIQYSLKSDKITVHYIESLYRFMIISPSVLRGFIFRLSFRDDQDTYFTFFNVFLKIVLLTR